MLNKPFILNAHMVIAYDDADERLEEYLEKIRLSSISTNKVIDARVVMTKCENGWLIYKLNIAIISQDGSPPPKGMYLLENGGRVAFAVYGYQTIPGSALNYSRSKGHVRMSDLPMFKKKPEEIEEVA